MKIIDFHTHIFPDNLAGKALRSIESTGGIKPKFDGTLKGLINSMDNAGVSISVVLSIATKPKQFNSIFNWARSIYSERIIPFPSVHPDDEEVHQHILQPAGTPAPIIKLFFRKKILSFPIRTV